MSNIDYIIHLCHDIQEQGKTPSVALIRSLASKPLTIPEVIKSMKYWKANPEARPKVKAPAQVTQSTTNQSLEQRVNQLETQLTQVINELDLLKNQVN